jgi:hypothetical protein
VVVVATAGFGLVVGVDVVVETRGVVTVAAAGTGADVAGRAEQPARPSPTIVTVVMTNPR